MREETKDNVKKGKEKSAWQTKHTEVNSVNLSWNVIGNSVGAGGTNKEARKYLQAERHSSSNLRGNLPVGQKRGVTAD